MRNHIAVSSLLLAACWLAGHASARQASVSDSTDMLRGITCGEYLQTARLANPGEKPSPDRRREAEEAQDSLVNTDRRYEECPLATGYDYECERRRYYDEQQARQNARRAGVVVGVVARGIVRD